MISILNEFVKKVGTLADFGGDREIWATGLGYFTEGWLAHEKSGQYGHVHQDDDGHWYLVPEEYTELFLKQLDDIACFDNWDKREDLISEFESNFKEYRLSGGVESLRVLMETK